jgi:hypothetical protein
VVVVHVDPEQVVAAGRSCCTARVYSPSTISSSAKKYCVAPGTGFHV